MPTLTGVLICVKQRLCGFQGVILRKLRSGLGGLLLGGETTQDSHIKTHEKERLVQTEREVRLTLPWRVIYNHQTKMKKGTTANIAAANLAHVSGGHAKGVQMTKQVNGNHVDHRAQNGDCKSRQKSGQVKSIERSLKDSNVTPKSHQRRWSADFPNRVTSPVIIVRKNKKEPQPPQRRASLQPCDPLSHSSFKRYSCPPIEILSLSSQSSSSCSSTSSISSCYSPISIRASVITGNDPLGWKLQPKSSFTSPRARAKRLSLQIPLPVVFPDSKSTPTTLSESDNTPNQDLSPKTKPPLKPKPLYRRYSDSVFLRSPENSIPLVTVQQLSTVHLRRVLHSDESDDVFSEGTEDEIQVTTRPRKKIAPPVPEKTAMARQIAQLIAQSRRRSVPAPTKTKAKKMYTCVMKPTLKSSHQNMDHGILHATKTAGLCLDNSCNRDRSSRRFPGREI